MKQAEGKMNQDEFSLRVDTRILQVPVDVRYDRGHDESENEGQDVMMSEEELYMYITKMSLGCLVRWVVLEALLSLMTYVNPNGLEDTDTSKSPTNHINGSLGTSFKELKYHKAQEQELEFGIGGVKTNEQS